MRREVADSGPSLGAQLRINCLTLCGGLHHHHSVESAELFPYLRDRHPRLNAVLDRLDDEHAILAGLLDDLQKLMSAGSTDPGALRGEIDRLVDEIEAHLAYEEQHLIAIMNALP